MNAIGVNLIWCAFQISLLSVVVWALLVALRRSPPAARSLLAVVGLAAVVLLSALTIVPLPSWWDVAETLSVQELWANLTETSAESETNVNSQSSPPVDGSVVESASSAGRDDAPESALINGSFLDAWRDSFHTLAASEDSTAAAWGWPSAVAVILVVMWGIGIWNLIAGLRTVQRYLRRSVPVVDRALLELVDLVRAELCCRRPITLLECDNLSTAATTGWLRPAILLPPEWKSWTDAERRAVLAHEIAHIARHDYLAALGAQVSLALHYYHPLLHWLVGRMRLEQELAADAAAAAVAGGQTTYLKILADLALRQPDRRVGWPARLFLPTRRTFLRRIEMLRDENCMIAARTRLWPATTVGLLAVAAVLAAGFRSPGDWSTSPLATAAEAEVEVAAASGPFDTRYFAEESDLVIALRPAQLVKQQGAQELAGMMQLQQGLVGLPFADIDQVIFNIPHDRAQQPRCVLRARMPHDWNEFIKNFETPQTKQYAGKTYLVTANSLALYRPDDRSIVVASERAVRRLLDGKRPRQNLVASSGWKKVHNAHIAIAVGHEFAELIRREYLAGLKASALASMFSPLLDNAEAAFIGASIGDEIEIDGYYICEDAKGAKEVAETVGASLTFARNMVRQLSKDLSRIPSSNREAYSAALQTAAELLEDARVERTALDGDKRLVVHVQATTGLEKLLVDLIVKASISARDAARRTAATNNLRKLAIAMHNYHDVNGHLPPAVVLGPDGKTPHSWRVALLPYLEANDLYERYRFAEPWDSEHNKEIMAQMPSVFRSPTDPASTTHAAYYVLTGPVTPFSGKPSKKGTRFAEIVDGTSLTIMFVEAKRDIPWTKPEDIPYDAAKPLPKLGGFHSGGFNVGYCDARTVFFSKDLNEKMFRSLVDKNENR